MTTVRIKRPVELDDDQDDEDRTCSYCGWEAKNRRDHERHAAGLDRKRLECPLQDIDAIKLQEQAQARGANWASKVLW